jgi:SAM-dependent methyltransferase
MKKTLTRIVWLASIKIRSSLLPYIDGTPLHWVLRFPSRFLRRFEYRDVAKDSIFYREEEMEMCSLRPHQVLDVMIRRFDPKTVLDVGCGTGQTLDYLLSKGIDAVGIEGSKLAISKAKNRRRITRVDLNRPVSLGRKFDAVFCYEVVEHIHPDYLEALLSTLCSHGDLLIMSHAQPGQAGEGHYNEQLDDYWIDHLARKNFVLDPASTEEMKNCGDYFAKNMLVFRKAAEKAA